MGIKNVSCCVIEHYGVLLSSIDMFSNFDVSVGHFLSLYDVSDVALTQRFYRSHKRLY